MAQLRTLGKVVGEDGAAATIQFAEPVTLPPGSQAKVVNLGDSNNAILQLHIPSGRAGADGADGVNGQDGAKGDTGATGPRGRGATISIHSVEYVDSDEEATIENIGNEIDSEWVIKIPKPKGSVVDSSFVQDSENPVQSRVIQEAIAEKANISDIPTKVSDLENDSEFISSGSVEVMIEDAIVNAGSIAVPVDDALSETSANPVQNKIVTEEIGKKVDMTLEDVLDEDTNAKVGERVSFKNDTDEVSMVLTGSDIAATVLTKTVAERRPVIVPSLPDVGDDSILYLVPSGDNNYSMHLWMDVAGEMKYANVSYGDSQDAPVYTAETPIRIDNQTISLNDSGTGIGTFGPNNDLTGESVIIPQITVNKKGLITDIKNRAFSVDVKHSYRSYTKDIDCNILENGFYAQYIYPDDISGYAPVLMDGFRAYSRNASGNYVSEKVVYSILPRYTNIFKFDYIYIEAYNIGTNAIAKITVSFLYVKV